jgi:hypothetical protein
MTDLFERQLAEQLRSRPLPEGVPGLAQRSIARGHRIRRRRVAGVAMALVLLLVVPGVTWTAARRLDTNPAPVTPPRTPTLAAPAGPLTVILDPVYRQPGPDPYVSTVRDETIWSPTGKPLDEMGADQFGTVVEFGTGYAWLTRTGREVRVNVSSQPVPVPPKPGEIRGLEPGPGGSAMLRTDRGPVLVTRDGVYVTPDDPMFGTARIVATADALWVEHNGHVVQVDARDLQGDLTRQVDHPQWQGVVVGDPVSDRLVVTDQDGCNVVVNAEAAEPIWTGCDWELNAFSPNGRFAAGTHRYGSRSVVDLTTGRWLLAVDTETNPVHERMAVDNEGRLSLAMGDPSVMFASATCDLAGSCLIGARGTAFRLEFVLPNR